MTSGPRALSLSSKFWLSVTILHFPLTCSDRDVPELKRPEMVNTKKVGGGHFGPPYSSDG